MLSQLEGDFPITIGNYETIDVPVKPGRLAVHHDNNGYHKIAFVNDENKKDILIVHHGLSKVTVEDLSDLKIIEAADASTDCKINQIAFGKDPNILYVSTTKSSVYEIHLNEREVNKLSNNGWVFSDRQGSVYLHTDKEIHKLNDEDEGDSSIIDTTLYCKTTKILSFPCGTTCIDSDGNVVCLNRKPFCSEYIVYVYTHHDGQEIRSYGLLYYGDSFSISQHDYTVAAEGDSIVFFHPDGRLLKTVKGFGLVSSIQFSSDDLLIVADSWNKQLFLQRFTPPPQSLYDYCIRQTLLHLDTLPISELPTQIIRLFEDYSFRVKIEIWTTKELEIAFTEVFTDHDTPIRRGRVESRAVITSSSNSKKFFLKLKLGTEYSTVRQMIGARLKRPIDNMELYTIQHYMPPNKLPESGILKQEHKKFAVIFA